MVTSSHGGCILPKKDHIQSRPPSTPFRWPPRNLHSPESPTVQHASTGYMTRNTHAPSISPSGYVTFAPPPLAPVNPRLSSGRFYPQRLASAGAKSPQIQSPKALSPLGPRSPEATSRPNTSPSPMPRKFSLYPESTGARDALKEFHSLQRGRAQSLGGSENLEGFFNNGRSTSFPIDRAKQMASSLPAYLRGVGQGTSPRSPLHEFASKQEDAPRRFHAVNERNKNKINVRDWKGDMWLRDWYKATRQREKDEKAIANRAAMKDDKRLYKIISRQHEKEALRRAQHADLFATTGKSKLHHPAIKTQAPVRKPANNPYTPGGAKPQGPPKQKILATSRQMTGTIGTQNRLPRKCSLADSVPSAIEDVELVSRSNKEPTKTPLVRKLQWKNIIASPKLKESKIQDISIWVNPGVFVTRTVQS
mmetsp:Transcript_9929/g.13496  ORF Transcript_9929/g.13496 Transcript_9929/m.13496 type:complete len:421 (+) Transcript_9929:132-1394(+)